MLVLVIEKWRGRNVSVKLLDNEAFYGYRVRRTVNGKLYQEYFSLKQEQVWRSYN